MAKTHQLRADKGRKIDESVGKSGCLGSVLCFSVSASRMKGFSFTRGSIWAEVQLRPHLSFLGHGWFSSLSLPCLGLAASPFQIHSPNELRAVLPDLSWGVHPLWSRRCLPLLPPIKPPPSTWSPLVWICGICSSEPLRDPGSVTPAPGRAWWSLHVYSRGSNKPLS